MRARATVFRVLRIMAISLAALLLLAFALVQFQQHLLRHRAERLLADFHSIRLNQTTWPEAQSIMQRWRNFGYADGPCNATDCVFHIDLQSPVDRIFMDSKGHYRNVPPYLAALAAHALYLWTAADLSVRYTVQDGKVVQASILYRTSLHNGNELIVNAGSRSALARSHGIMGNHDSIAAHPDYIAGRPGGCTFCELIKITYTSYVAPDELARITNLNLACITRWRACQNVEELLPAAAPWHMYRDAPEASAPLLPNSHPCDIAPRALARDANTVLEVEAESAEKRRNLPAGEGDPEHRSTLTSQVKLLRVLRGRLPWSVGSTFTLAPYDPEPGEWRTAEHVEKDRRYLIFLDDSYTDKDLFVMPGWCGVLPDTPDVLAQTIQGIQQDVPIRNVQHQSSFID